MNACAGYYFTLLSTTDAKPTKMTLTNVIVQMSLGGYAHTFTHTHTHTHTNIFEKCILAPACPDANCLL